MINLLLLLLSISEIILNKMGNLIINYKIIQYKIIEK